MYLKKIINKKYLIIFVCSLTSFVIFYAITNTYHRFKNTNILLEKYNLESLNHFNEKVDDLIDSEIVLIYI
jgi:hypothetical protein